MTKEEKKELEIEEKRDRIADRLEKIIKNKYGEDIKIYRAPWDIRRIAWEDTVISDFYHSNHSTLIDLLEEACEGENCFIELLNPVEGAFYD